MGKVENSSDFAFVLISGSPNRSLDECLDGEMRDDEGDKHCEDDEVDEFDEHDRARWQWPDETRR